MMFIESMNYSVIKPQLLLIFDNYGGSINQILKKACTQKIIVPPKETSNSS